MTIFNQALTQLVNKADDVPSLMSPVSITRGEFGDATHLILDILDERLELLFELPADARAGHDGGEVY